MVVKYKTKILGILILAVIMISISVSLALLIPRYCSDCNDLDDFPDPPSVEPSTWENISFVLVNESVKTINDFEGSILLLEFSSSNCLDCSTQLPILDEFWEIVSSSNDSLVLLTLFIDLSTQKELLDYYISNNITWLVGCIDYSSYSSLGLSLVPSFHIFDENSIELNSVQTNLSLEDLWVFVNWHPSSTLSVFSVYLKQKEFLNNHISKASMALFDIVPKLFLTPLMIFVLSTAYLMI